MPTCLTDWESIPRFRRIFVWAVHATLFALSGIIAFLLRFDLSIPNFEISRLVYGVIIWVVVKTLVFYFRGLDHGWWKFVSISDVIHIALGNLIGSAISAALILLLAPRGFPRSVYFLDLLICFLNTAGVRMATRMVADAMQTRKAGSFKRVLIYGAGNAGVMLLREIRSDSNLLYTVCGFVDDDPHKKKLLVQGIPVVGTGSDLPALVEKYDVQEVLIALPSVTGNELAQILHDCQVSGAQSKIIPTLNEILTGAAQAGDIREVDVEDLLGRSPVHLDQTQISARLKNRAIMVTGAAGSIGSELCRQIALFEPAAIIGFDISENSLFHLERDMSAKFATIPFFPAIGNIQNRARVCEILEAYSPSMIYHAAAYKHVPMMETHVVEAVENNILGTYQIARAAAEYGVEDFVMISSDKAVQPVNVMGATKRFSELLIRSLQRSGTNYVSVRFGNVLGSNGSVVPLFKAQIRQGGPVTITHREMQRYFMTIPEACQLVLQASAMGNGGEIFVLDMGEPVRIVDLARNLILLSGLRPDQDIKIEFTGVRPGEKLHEELNLHDENVLPTFHEKIRIFAGKGAASENMSQVLATLRILCDRRDERGLILQLKEMIPDYNPTAQILERVLLDPKKMVAS